MILPELAESLHDAGPLLLLALVILVGTAFGGLARRIHLPSITGQILAGILVGKAGLDLFSEESLDGLQPLTHCALGLIAVTVGAHLNLRRLRNAGRRLFFLLITESTITPIIVYLATWGLAGSDPGIALLFATVAIATAPATVVTLVKETRSKGVFVKTLIAAVALNNMACIVLFEVARALTRSWELEGVHFGVDLVPPLTRLAIAVAIGAGVALLMDVVSRYAMRPERIATWAVIALVFTVGVAATFEVSPLLACLTLGFVQTNISRGRDQLVDSVFADFEPAILTVFFTLAGMHLSPEHLESAGLVAFLLFSGRFAGKLLSADLAMRFAHATERVRANLGLALIPQAGVAVGLVLLIQEDPAFAPTAGLFASVVLAVVAANEIVGPLATRFALARAGEVDRDRMRLIDFLQEENIVTDFRASTKQEAIEKLVDLLITSHHLKHTSREELLRSVLEREEQGSTCLGGGLAVPHGIVPEAHPMVGVMALSRDGLDIETPDHRPVHCMVLLGTAEAERDRHLQVLASLARTVGIDITFQEQLFDAKSAAHAYELLHGEESEDFNYFLEED
ncbi:MAG: cation:proton antiporter [Deltaproteobacteria bacterium]|nr:cation:proton antiporter [Deltaproteobacteria bacterium]MBW2418446.1 cation:proton antiporter [Deltaproteobacteria bacterium]